MDRIILISKIILAHHTQLIVQQEYIIWGYFNRIIYLIFIEILVNLHKYLYRISLNPYQHLT